MQFSELSHYATTGNAQTLLFYQKNKHFSLISHVISFYVTTLLQVFISKGYLEITVDTSHRDVSIQYVGSGFTQKTKQPHYTQYKITKVIPHVRTKSQFSQSIRSQIVRKMKWLSVTKAKYRRVIFKSKLHLLKAPLDFAIHCNIYGTYTIGRVTSHILERKCGFRTQGLSFLYARGKHFSCYSTQVNAHNQGIKYF